VAAVVAEHRFVVINDHSSRFSIVISTKNEAGFLFSVGETSTK
jgi:hypothetical protein